MSQITLPFELPDDGKEAVFIVDSSNAEAVDHLEKWPEWPMPVTLLTGPPKSGRSTLGILFARKSNGRVIDMAEQHDEELLFHAWNKAHSDKQPLLIIADEPPPNWQIELPDLQTRIAATPKVHIEEPSDALIEARIQHHFERRSLAVPDTVTNYVLKRMDRSHASLAEFIAVLDRMAFDTGRRITVRLARECLAELGFIDL